jgi:stage III sporulation protein AG
MSPQKLLKTILSLSKKETRKNNSSTKSLTILLVLGIGFLLFSHFYGSGKKDLQSVTASTLPKALPAKDIATFKSNQKKNFPSMEAYASYYEERLTDILNQVKGVSNVRVLVTLNTDIQNVYKTDTQTKQNRTTEQDQNGGTRQTNEQSKDENVVIIDGKDGKKPVVITKKSPVIQGVLVVAEGAENPTIKSWIQQAVSSVLDVPSYNVYVLPFQ